jgi:alkylated DNA repair protein (DNA oxidative demethylase)
MSVQGDLFAEPASAVPWPEGLVLWEDVVSAGEARALEATIDAAPLKPFRFGPWEGKRLTAYYGHGYDFGRGRLAEAPPFPKWLRFLASRAEALAGQPDGAFVQALVIRYDSGAGIGWHRDRPQFGTVAGLSLTSAARLRFRRRTGAGFERATILLPANSLYFLEGRARWEWEHSILPAERTRRSITLRTLRTD